MSDGQCWRNDREYLRIIPHAPEPTDGGMVTPEHSDGNLEMFTLLDGEAAEDLRGVQGRQLASPQPQSMTKRRRTADMAGWE
jgi:hypothetical protein